MLGASRWPKHSLHSHRAWPGQLGAAAGRGPGSLPAHRHHNPFLCLQPPSDFQPCPPTAALTFLSQRWHFQLMLIFLPLQVFLSTSKAAGIKLALFSITQHQRHLTDAEEQRFGLDVGRKLSNASSTETWEEASGERLGPPGGCTAAARLSAPSASCCSSLQSLTNLIRREKGVRSCGWTVVAMPALLPHHLLHYPGASPAVSICRPLGPCAKTGCPLASQSLAPAACDEGESENVK